MDKITLVCYDISSNKLRYKIFKCLKDFGMREQYSIFLLQLDEVSVKRCKEEIKKILDNYKKEYSNGDSLIFIERPKNIISLLGEEFFEKSSEFKII